MPRLRTWWLLGPALTGLVAFTASHAGPRSYEVQLGFSGYSGLTDSEDCAARVNKQGYDSLTGTVKGVEPDGKSDEEVLYQGVLRRSTRIDNCETRPKDPGKPDELVWCVATLTGEAQMNVEIRIDGEEGRGAYVNAKPVVGSVKNLKVEGDCAAADMVQMRKEYPGGESGGSPDGQAIPESAPPKFFVAGVPRLRAGYFPPDKNHPGWGLRVLRAAP
jgi:hypothetical protein